MDVVIQFAVHKLGFKLKDIIVYAWSIGGFTGNYSSNPASHEAVFPQETPVIAVVQREGLKALCKDEHAHVYKCASSLSLSLTHATVQCEQLNLFVNGLVLNLTD